MVEGNERESFETGVGCQVTVNTTDAEAQTVYSYANIMSENVIIKSEN